MTAPTGALHRRTTIELGPLRITREERWMPLPDDFPYVDPPRARRSGGWGAAGVLGTMLALSAGGLAVASTRAAPPPRYSVSVRVPERITPVAARPAPRMVRPVSTPSPVAPSLAARVAPTAALSADDAAPADRGTRAAALAAALHSGEMQEWYEAAGGTHGFVVAGPAERDGAQECRALSVLTRAPGGTDRVDQRRDCFAAVAG